MSGSAEGRAALVHMASGYAYTFISHALARLGLADLLAAAPLPIDVLAQRLGVLPDRLARLVGAAVGAGLLERRGERVALNATSRWLVRTTPGNVHDLVLLSGARALHDAWAHLDVALRDEQSAFEHAHGEDFFVRLDRDPSLAAIFHGAGRGEPGWERTIALACDLSGAKTLVDVGGGDGAFLDALVDVHPHLEATLFERPSALAHVAHDRRWAVCAGDFLDGVPAGADRYVLRRVLHDWDDERAVRILGHCRRALGADGRVLVLEYLRVPGREAATALLDLTMLVLTRGRERSEAEYAELLAKAGLVLEDVVATPVGMAVLVARAGPP